MPPGDPAVRRATIADLIAAEAAGRRVELLNGVLVDKEAAGNRHSGAHNGVQVALGGLFRGRGDDSRPGGWVFRTDPSILAPTGDVVQPDVAGWKRERAPADDEFPLTSSPDWVCEVMYSSHLRDMVQKHPIYRVMRVGHYWAIDLKANVLTVYRWTPDGYLAADFCGPAGKVRLEPFDAVELNAWELFGYEDEPLPG